MLSLSAHLSFACSAPRNGLLCGSICVFPHVSLDRVILLWHPILPDLFRQLCCVAVGCALLCALPVSGLTAFVVVHIVVHLAVRLVLYWLCIWFCVDCVFVLDLQNLVVRTAIWLMRYKAFMQTIQQDLRIVSRTVRITAHPQSHTLAYRSANTSMHRAGSLAWAAVS